MNHDFLAGGVGITGKANSVLGLRYDREGQVRLDVDSSFTGAPVVTNVVNDNGYVGRVCGK